MSRDSLGGLSPLLTATKHVNIYKKYLEQKEDNLLIEGEQSKLNPNVMDISRLDKEHDVDSKADCLPLGRTPQDAEIYGKLNAEIFRSGIIYVDSDLKLMQAMQNEKELFAFAGLKIGPDDDLKLMITKDGRIVGAIAVEYKHMGQVAKLKYIDVDDESCHFKRTFNKLQDMYSPLKFFDNDAIEHYQINKDILTNS